jgi:putative peptidoglycan lipid II flippase
MWYQLPYGIFAVAIATAFFPELSSAAEKKDWSDFAGQFSRGLRATGMLIIPMAAMLFGLAVPLATLYRAGSFTEKDVLMVAGVLMVWALGLFSFASYMFVLRSFYSMQDTRTPMITNVFATMVQVGLYAGLVTYLGRFGPAIALLGIPAGDLIGYTFHATVLAVLLRRRVGPLGFGPIVSSLGRVGGASLAIGLVVLAIVRAVPFVTATKSGALVGIAVLGAAGLGSIYLLSRLMRVPEIAYVDSFAGKALSRVRGRLPGGRS